MTNESNLGSIDIAKTTPPSIVGRITHTIASKIFGLAIFLLALTIGLSIYLLAEVSRSSVDIAIISRHDLPLAAAVEDVNEYGLRRRLAFARWFGALNRDKPNLEAVAEARANYEEFTPKLSAGFARIREIIDDGSDLLTIEMKTDGRELVLELTQEDREIAAVEGWEALADFDPALFRSGALERWRLIRTLPSTH